MLYVTAVCEQHLRDDVIAKKPHLVKQYINAGQGREKGLLFLGGSLFSYQIRAEYIPALGY